jgi:hypothetical protein
MIVKECQALIFHQKISLKTILSFSSHQMKNLNVDLICYLPLDHALV